MKVFLNEAMDQHIDENNSKTAMHNDLIISYQLSKREVQEEPLQQTQKFRALFDEYDSLMEFEKAEYNLRKTFISQCEEENPEMPYKDIWKDFTSLYMRH